MVLLRIEEHVIVVEQVCLRSLEHLSGPLRLLGAHVNHRPTGMSYLLVPHEDRAARQQGLRLALLRPDILLSLFEYPFVIVLRVFNQRVLEGLRELLQAVRLGSHVSQRDLSVLCQYLHFLGDVRRQSGLVVPQHGVVDRLRHRLHLVQFLQAARRGVEEIEFVELPIHLVALLGHMVVAESDRGLGQLREAVLVLELLGRLEGHLDVTAREGQVESLLQVVLEEKCDL